MATFRSIRELTRALQQGSKLLSNMFLQRKTVAVKYDDALDTLDGDEDINISSVKMYIDKLNLGISSYLAAENNARRDQYRDLIRWLQSITNPYVHFGDLDLADIAIYQHEYYRHLGARASFFVPDDYEHRIANGSTERYTSQLAQYGKMTLEDPRVQPLIDCIHRHHKGYDQEGYIL